MPSGPGMRAHKKEFSMTTSVKVSAHCASTKQVRITTSGPDRETAEVVIQDGETNEQVVYDDMTISVKEEVKPD